MVCTLSHSAKDFLEVRKSKPHFPLPQAGEA